MNDAKCGLISLAFLNLKSNTKKGIREMNRNEISIVMNLTVNQVYAIELAALRKFKKILAQKYNIHLHDITEIFN